MIDKLLAMIQEDKSISLQTQTGYSIWVKRFGKNKSYTFTVADPGTNEYIKIGTINNIEKFREIFYGRRN